MDWAMDIQWAISKSPRVDYMGTYDLHINFMDADTEDFIPMTGSPFITEVQAIMCGPGARQDDLGSECWCLPGFEKEVIDAAAGTYRCKECPDGFYKSTFSLEIACDQCPFREDTNGTIGSTDASACKCAAGYYDIRRPFDPSVAPFQQGTKSPDDDLEIALCFENSYYKPDPLLEFTYEELTKFRCHPCPECAVCPGGEEMGVAQFFWSEAHDIPASYGPTYGAPIVDSFDRVMSNNSLYKTGVRTSRAMFRFASLVIWFLPHLILACL
eukprot:SAG31_NODE_672_length_12933_cov_3.746143_10_plen_270_part_00